MVETIVGKNVADDIYNSSMLACLMTEKRAEFSRLMEKDAAWADVLNALKSVFGGGAAVVGGGAKALSKLPGAILSLGIAGAGAGALGGLAYSSLADSLSEVDSKERLNQQAEAKYKLRMKEMKNKEWFAKIRSMHDELKKNMKHMTPKEYRAAYESLVSEIGKGA